MLQLQRQISRASRVTFKIPTSTRPVLPLARLSLALDFSTSKYPSTHTRDLVTSNKRPFQRVTLLGRSPPTVAQGHASYVTQTMAPNHQPAIDYQFEPNTGTWQYIVADPSSGRAAIVDPVLDYDAATQLITTTTADSLLSLVKDKGLTIDWILETHAHADHLTAASYLQAQLARVQGGQKPPIGIGKRINQVQGLFGERYGIAEDEYTNVFDKLFDDDEVFSIGSLEASVIHLPGHTPDHLGYKIGGTSEKAFMLATRVFSPPC